MDVENLNWHQKPVMGFKREIPSPGHVQCGTVSAADRQKVPSFLWKVLGLGKLPLGTKKTSLWR